MSDAGSENGDKDEGPSIGIYEGERNALKERHGKGKNAFPNGDSYEGGYANSKRSGHGMYKWKAGHRYVGDFTSGKRHGQGVYVYSNGDAYQGSWENDLKHGHGIYTFQNGSKKSGMWIEGKLNGPGEIIYADHKIVGVFKNDDRMDMPVTIHYTKTGFTKTIHDPSLKSGMWIEGKLNGPGEIIYADHKIVGVFKNDDRMDMPVTIHYTKTGFTKTIHDPSLVGMSEKE
eukprot:jgi/Hompol1/1098/HPOL_001631-RA